MFKVVKIERPVRPVNQTHDLVVLTYADGRRGAFVRHDRTPIWRFIRKLYQYERRVA